MRISEIEAREDLEAIAASTLGRAFNQQLGGRFRVRFARSGDGQAWLEQPLLSAWFTRDIGPTARRFLADGFRFTRVPWRTVPQLVLGSALATRLGLLATSQRRFRVEPAVPSAEHRVILPGNRRLRLFDFRRGVTRVVLKHGFSDDAMKAEIAIRGSGRSGPFPALSAFAEDYSWFEEPIQPGYALSRCPPWLPYDRLSSRALDSLDQWAAGEGFSERHTEDYVNGRLEAIQRAWGERVALPRDLTGRLMVALPAVAIGPSHGDCQPGNVLIDRRGRHAQLIDWEFYGLRSRWYDRIVWALALRWPEGVAKRAREAVREPGPLLMGLPDEETARRAAIAIAILEDICWRLAAWESGPMQGLPPEVGPLAAALRHLYP